MLQPHVHENPGAGTPGLEGHTKNSHPENSKSPELPQALRLAWLRRRFDVSPELAIMLATLALGEVQA
jgi:hypothetical protein